MKSRSVTIHDVAREAGVSTASVSRVVNGERPVLDETAQRVRRAIEKLGYRANPVARSLKTKATMTIGVVAPELSSDFFMLIAESMEETLATHGYSLIVCSSHEKVEDEAKRVRQLSERMVDGIAVIPVSGHGDHLRGVPERGIPLVFIDRIANGVDADVVLVDNEGGARAATEALIADGFRRIGFLGADPEATTTGRERFDGYRKAMEAAGLSLDEEYVSFGNMHIESGYRSMKRMLAKPGAPEAWFIINAYIHMGATNYLMTAGKAHRDHIVFASFDEMSFSPLLQFCRYSVSQPIGDMGALAANMLLDRIEARNVGAPQVARLKTTVIRHY